MSEWGVLLEGVYLSGGDGSQWQTIEGLCSVEDPVPHGCLTSPPDGLGLPGLRTEDVVYNQRDGVKHFSDWYEPRIITLADVAVGPDGCSGCVDTVVGGGSGYGGPPPYGDGPYGGGTIERAARTHIREIMQAWSRKCDDVELVIFTDCHGTGDSALTGPFGVIGRPRVASMQWVGQGTKFANLLLRFDAVDHRMYILDECGTPGSGETCMTLEPNVSAYCRTYNKCYPRCYANNTGVVVDPITGTNIGTLCAYPTITLTGPLTLPRIENVVTGETIVYSGTIAEGETVVIDTYNGTATQDGQSRTHLLSGSVRFQIPEGDVTLRLVAFSPNDTGTAEVCWRPAVEWA